MISKLKLHVVSGFKEIKKNNLFSLFDWDGDFVKIKKEFAELYTMDSIDACDFVIIPHTVFHAWRANKSKIKETILYAKVHKKKIIIINGSDQNPCLQDDSILFISPGIEKNLVDYIQTPSLFSIRDFPRDNFATCLNRNIGFVGQASIDSLEILKYSYKIARGKTDNLFGKNKLCWPIYFPMVSRYQWLRRFEKNYNKCVFIKRKKYSAGESLSKERAIQDYFDNIKNSTFTFCPRGTGNYSTRFYHTLALGRIPVVTDDFMPLPFPDIIEWDSIVLKVSISDMKNISQHILGFSDAEIINRQLAAINTWTNYLSMEGFYCQLKTELQKIK